MSKRKEDGLVVKQEECVKSKKSSLPDASAKNKTLNESNAWDLDEDNCGIDPSKNPCGDANEY